MSPLLERVRGLAHPRSRRGQLWACVYCGAVDGEAVQDADDADSPR